MGAGIVPLKAHASVFSHSKLEQSLWIGQEIEFLRDCTVEIVLIRPHICSGEDPPHYSSCLAALILWDNAPQTWGSRCLPWQKWACETKCTHDDHWRAIGSCCATCGCWQIIGEHEWWGKFPLESLPIATLSATSQAFVKSNSNCEVKFQQPWLGEPFSGPCGRRCWDMRVTNFDEDEIIFSQLGRSPYPISFLGLWCPTKLTLAANTSELSKLAKLGGHGWGKLDQLELPNQK